MTETGLIIAEVAFLVLLYLFIWAVVRSSTKALRAAEVETAPPERRDPPPPPAPVPAAPTGRGVPPPPAPVTAAPGRVAGQAATLPRARGAAVADPAPVAAGRPRLVVISSASVEPGLVVPLETGVTIGRSKSNQLTVADQFISHTHARVFRRAGGHLIEDMGSLNGTYLNGRRLKKEAELTPGDEVRLGETVLRFEVS
ncbi:MAG: FHA domain-containing protein [Thermoleophilia bacterium]|jgi:hypothetical protein|nr:FHA domain-containing protein [Thermoleophilia bacterium]